MASQSCNTSHFLVNPLIYSKQRQSKQIKMPTSTGRLTDPLNFNRSLLVIVFSSLLSSIQPEISSTARNLATMRKISNVAFFRFMILLCTTVALARSRFIVEKSSVSVLWPEELRGDHDAALANFGAPEYGFILTGRLYYPSEYASREMGCEEFKSLFKPPSTSQPMIALIDRGGCYFAQKVYHAQLAGAKAVLVADNVTEPLLTMDAPDQETPLEKYVDHIDIPSAFIDRAFGESLKQAFLAGKEVVVKMDWTRFPHPDNRVEYEFWTNSNDECGIRCDDQTDFVKNFRGHAQLLERGGYTLFTPHYITWYCPKQYIDTMQCKSQCINKGRYCAPDPEKDFSSGYQGKDVLLENLRQLCVYKVANESHRPWMWWDYVTDFHIRCSMKEKKYGRDCAEKIIASLHLSVEKVGECMGDAEVDAINPILEMQQSLQASNGQRGDITILPTLVINNRQYRGKLQSNMVLEAICAGFEEGTEPRLCLTQNLETNECLENHGGCWYDAKSNVSACKDTFRGRICQCPLVGGIQYQGDGYTKCEAVGPGRCSVNHGGCWSETQNKQTFTACSNSVPGCKCPPGFRGDGHACEDVNECKERSACQCEGCHCSNTWGGYECSCSFGRVYIKDQDTCVANTSSGFRWFVTLLVLAGFAAFGLTGYVFYRYRLRSYMDSEIMAIMSQYMPLDNHNGEAEPLRLSDGA